MKEPGEKGRAMRAHIVSVALRLFAKNGYHATPIEAVLIACNISRGALYHHFPGKEALFEAALEAVEAELADETRRRTQGIADPAAALRAGCDAFLEAAQTSRFRQIVLIDAPGVVGWHKWREIDGRHGFGLMKQALGQAARHRHGQPDLVDTFAHVLLAALMEIALLMVRDDGDPGPLRKGKAALAVLIDRILAPD